MQAGGLRYKPAPGGCGIQHPASSIQHPASGRGRGGKLRANPHLGHRESVAKFRDRIYIYVQVNKIKIPIWIN